VTASPEVRVPAPQLRAFAASVYVAAGVPEPDAVVAAELLVQADLLGFDTHGIAHLAAHPGYAPGLAGGHVAPSGRFEVVRETAATALVDGHGVLGAVTAARATDLAIDKADRAGVGVVAVREGRHFGAACLYALRIAEAGMVGVVATNASPWVVPTLGRERMLGTNPIAVSAPTGDERPFLCDVSTSTVAFGRIEHALRVGTPLAPGWAVDGTGRPTLDPAVVVDDGGLTPLGGTPDGSSHKGYALAASVDVLTGILTGTGWSKLLPVHTTQAAHTFVALQVEAFADPDVFRRDLRSMLDTLRASPPAEGAARVLVPGDREFEYRRDREAHGVPVPGLVLDELDALAANLGVAPLVRGQTSA
jgi:LDH2 family malate/lactate/ureidoglycolate dehydrogenase